MANSLRTNPDLTSTTEAEVDPVMTNIVLTLVMAQNAARRAVANMSPSWRQWMGGRGGGERGMRLSIYSNTCGTRAHVVVRHQFKRTWSARDCTIVRSRWGVVCRRKQAVVMKARAMNSTQHTCLVQYAKPVKIPVSRIAMT
jgi:hypothetical protein